MNSEVIRLDTSDEPTVVVEAGGGLKVAGWEEPEIEARSHGGDNECCEGALTVEDEDGALRIVFQDDGELNVPSGANLVLESVRGDARISSLEGNLTVGDVAGDLSLGDVGPTQVEAVHGDLSARNVQGDLRVNTVAADASVRAVDGDFAAEAIGADLLLRGVDGSVSAVAGADATVSLDPEPGRGYHVTAGSSITCRLPQGADVDVRITSGSGTVVAKLLGVDVPAPEGGTHHLTLGEGGPEVILEAGGGVALAGGSVGEGTVEDVDIGVQFAEEFGSMAEEIAQQVEAKTEQMMAQLSEHLSKLSETLPGVLKTAGLSGVEADRIAERVRLSGERTAERAAKKLRKRAQAAARRAERKAAKARRAASRGEHRIGRHAGARGGLRGRGRGLHRTHRVDHEPDREPVSDEERLTILRMLEQGKITVDQAQDLLKALEGRVA